MKTRIITGVLASAVLIAVLMSTTLVFNIAYIIVSLLAFYELLNASKLTHKFLLTSVNFVFAILMIYSMFKSLKLSVACIFAYLIILFIISVLDNKHVEINDVSTSLFDMIYSVCFIFFLPLIRSNIHGKLYLLILFAGVISTDTFAYFTGCFFGKHKLCPSISPKKTIEGSAGGWLGAVFVLTLTGVILNKLNYSVNFISLIIFALICGGISQIGDLTASLIKRNLGIKDYGKILPSHGGIMDRLDSIILTAPVLYAFMTYFPVLG